MDSSYQIVHVFLRCFVQCRFYSAGFLIEPFPLVPIGCEFRFVFSENLLGVLEVFDLALQLFVIFRDFFDDLSRLFFLLSERS